jgi:hypothetical protein
VTGSGALFSDALMMLLQIYVFMGGWVAGLIGLGLCMASRGRGASWRSIALIVVVCLAPPAVLVGGSFGVDALPFVETSNVALWILVGASAALILCGPLAAWRLFLRESAPRK